MVDKDYKYSNADAATKKKLSTDFPPGLLAEEHAKKLPSPEELVHGVFSHTFSEKSNVDMVNHPPHYTGHPSGIECIQVTEYFNFCLGNAIKYIWRADLKDGTEALKKARWYLDREIERREGKSTPEVRRDY